MAVKLAKVRTPEATDNPDGWGPVSDALVVPMPPELKEISGVKIIDTMETNPTIVFEEPGEYVLGKYQGFRELTIEGRQQRLYDLLTPGPLLVSVWGSTVLDIRFDTAIKKGMVVNSSVMVQYLGDIDTGKGNPAKNFRLAWK
jgi:hypothetical protein